MKMKIIFIRFIIFSIWLSIFLGAAFMISKEIKTQKFSKLIKIWMVSTIFILLAIPISLLGILQHLLNYTKPYLQLYIIRILWMVPIYAMNAWVALRFPKSAIYLDTLRECYEAYVIYNFTSFLLNYLKCSLDLIATLEEKRAVSHIFPANLILPKWKPGWPFIQNCKRGVLQYTVIRPLMTIIALITEMFGVYQDGIFSFRYTWIYTVIINNISQLFAMYCLILFYKATYQELKPMKPLGKFFCVKAVVFASFWQSVLIAFFVHSKILTENNTWKTYDSQTLQASLQDFCICIEMLFAAIAHYFCFSASPYALQTISEYSSNDNMLSNNDNLNYNTDNINNKFKSCNLGTNEYNVNQIQSSNNYSNIDQDSILIADNNNMNRSFFGSVWHSVKLMLNVSDVYEDVHQQVNYMIKSNNLKNRYRDKVAQNTNIMTVSTVQPDDKILLKNNFDTDDDNKLFMDCCSNNHNTNIKNDSKYTVKRDPNGFKNQLA
ncbi:unnamed protein product [Gordionus sp. m RMFG-2023]